MLSKSMVCDEQSMTKIIIEHLNKTLGSSMVNVIDFHLRLMNTSLEKICEEPDTVIHVLHQIFKDGSIILEKEIINALYQHFVSDNSNDSIILKLKSFTRYE